MVLLTAAANHDQLLEPLILLTDILGSMAALPCSHRSVHRLSPLLHHRHNYNTTVGEILDAIMAAVSIPSNLAPCVMFIHAALHASAGFISVAVLYFDVYVRRTVKRLKPSLVSFRFWTSYSLSLPLLQHFQLLTLTCEVFRHRGLAQGINQHLHAPGMKHYFQTNRVINKEPLTTAMCAHGVQCVLKTSHIYFMSM